MSRSSTAAPWPSATWWRRPEPAPASARARFVRSAAGRRRRVGRLPAAGLADRHAGLRAGTRRRTALRRALLRMLARLARLAVALLAVTLLPVALLAVAALLLRVLALLHVLRRALVLA